MRNGAPPQRGYTEDQQDYEGENKSSVPGVPIAAVNTTAGTGSECTDFYIVTDPVHRTKLAMVDVNCMVSIAVNDIDFMMSMPPGLTAATGMDALTHAIEAYVSTAASVFTDPLALKAIKMVFDYLPASYDGDMAAREQMHYAQCLAGMAFSNALLGIVHSMAHKTGAVFSTGHITHGCANAMYLPYVIRYNAKDERAMRRYAEIADYAGIPGKTAEEKVQALREKIWAYNQKFEIPHDMKAFGVDEAEFKSKVAEFSKNAVGDACTGSNPRAITPEQMEKLFGCCYYGTEVDF